MFRAIYKHSSIIPSYIKTILFHINRFIMPIKNNAEMRGKYE